jgi:hypothetical protein
MNLTLMEVVQLGIQELLALVVKKDIHRLMDFSAVLALQRLEMLYKLHLSC